MRSLTDGGLVQVAQAVLKTFISREYAARVQCVEYIDKQSHQEQRKIGMCLHELAVRTLGELLLTAMEYRDEPPGLFFRLLSQD
eukprot:6468073-Amphidinium_carterae.1